jgi:hypothetical protein
MSVIKTINSGVPSERLICCSPFQSRQTMKCRGKVTAMGRYYIYSIKYVADKKVPLYVFRIKKTKTFQPSILVLVPVIINKILIINKEPQAKMNSG